jgi:nucleoside-diphosphate-sugar epimerase
MTKKVLITGGSGFIGRHCLPLLLEHGYQVHAIARQPLLDISHPNLFWYSIDLFNAGIVSDIVAKIKPSHLLHLAWYAIPGQYQTSSENFRWVQASLDLLQIFADSGGERILMTGTCAEYDWRYGYCDERVTPLVPISPYGICKNSLSQLLSAFSNCTGISSSWARIFWLYGQYEHPNRLVSSVIKSLLADQTVECLTGYQIRDFLYIDDIANALVTTLDSDLTGAVNIGSGIPISIRELVEKIAIYLDRLDLIRFREVSSCNQEANLVVANCHRLRTELSWEPQFSLTQGIENTVNFWK